MSVAPRSPATAGTSIPITQPGASSNWPDHLIPFCTDDSSSSSSSSNRTAFPYVLNVAHLVDYCMLQYYQAPSLLPPNGTGMMDRSRRLSVAGRATSVAFLEAGGGGGSGADTNRPRPLTPRNGGEGGGGGGGSFGGGRRGSTAARLAANANSSSSNALGGSMLGGAAPSSAPDQYVVKTKPVGTVLLVGATLTEPAVVSSISRDNSGLHTNSSSGSPTSYGGGSGEGDEYEIEVPIITGVDRRARRVSLVDEDRFYVLTLPNQKFLLKPRNFAQRTMLEEQLTKWIRVANSQHASSRVLFARFEFLSVPKHSSSSSSSFAHPKPQPQLSGSPGVEASQQLLTSPSSPPTASQQQDASHKQQTASSVTKGGLFDHSACEGIIAFGSFDNPQQALSSLQKYARAAPEAAGTASSSGAFASGLPCRQEQLSFPPLGSNSSDVEGLHSHHYVTATIPFRFGSTDRLTVGLKHEVSGLWFLPSARSLGGSCSLSQLFACHDATRAPFVIELQPTSTPPGGLDVAAASLHNAADLKAKQKAAQQHREQQERAKPWKQFRVLCRVTWVPDAVTELRFSLYVRGLLRRDYVLCDPCCFLSATAAPPSSESNANNTNNNNSNSAGPKRSATPGGGPSSSSSAPTVVPLGSTEAYRNCREVRFVPPSVGLPLTIPPCARATHHISFLDPMFLAPPPTTALPPVGTLLRSSVFPPNLLPPMSMPQDAAASLTAESVLNDRTIFSGYRYGNDALRPAIPSLESGSIVVEVVDAVFDAVAQTTTPTLLGSASLPVKELLQYAEESTVTTAVQQHSMRRSSVWSQNHSTATSTVPLHPGGPIAPAARRQTRAPMRRASVTTTTNLKGGSTAVYRTTVPLQRPPPSQAATLSATTAASTADRVRQRQQRRYPIPLSKFVFRNASEALSSENAQLMDRAAADNFNLELTVEQPVLQRRPTFLEHFYGGHWDVSHMLAVDGSINSFLSYDAAYLPCMTEEGDGLSGPSLLGVGGPSANPAATRSSANLASIGRRSGLNVTETIIAATNRILAPLLTRGGSDLYLFTQSKNEKDDPVTVVQPLKTFPEGFGAHVDESSLHNAHAAQTAFADVGGNATQPHVGAGHGSTSSGTGAAGGGGTGVRGESISTRWSTDSAAFDRRNTNATTGGGRVSITLFPDPVFGDDSGAPVKSPREHNAHTPLGGASTGTTSPHSPQPAAGGAKQLFSVIRDWTGDATIPAYRAKVQPLLRKARQAAGISNTAVESYLDEAAADIQQEAAQSVMIRSSDTDARPGSSSDATTEERRTVVGSPRSVASPSAHKNNRVQYEEYLSNARQPLALVAVLRRMMSRCVALSQARKTTVARLAQQQVSAIQRSTINRSPGSFENRDEALGGGGGGVSSSSIVNGTPSQQQHLAASVFHMVTVVIHSTVSDAADCVALLSQWVSRPVFFVLIFCDVTAPSCFQGLPNCVTLDFHACPTPHDAASKGSGSGGSSGRRMSRTLVTMEDSATDVNGANSAASIGSPATQQQQQRVTMDEYAAPLLGVHLELKALESALTVAAENGFLNYARSAEVAPVLGPTALQVAWMPPEPSGTARKSTSIGSEGFFQLTPEKSEAESRDVSRTQGPSATPEGTEDGGAHAAPPPPPSQYQKDREAFEKSAAAFDAAFRRHPQPPPPHKPHHPPTASSSSSRTVAAVGGAAQTAPGGGALGASGNTGKVPFLADAQRGGGLGGSSSLPPNHSAGGAGADSTTTYDGNSSSMTAQQQSQQSSLAPHRTQEEDMGPTQSSLIAFDLRGVKVSMVDVFMKERTAREWELEQQRNRGKGPLLDDQLLRRRLAGLQEAVASDDDDEGDGHSSPTSAGDSKHRQQTRTSKSGSTSRPGSGRKGHTSSSKSKRSRKAQRAETAGNSDPQSGGERDDASSSDTSDGGEAVEGLPGVYVLQHRSRKHETDASEEDPVDDDGGSPKKLCEEGARGDNEPPNADPSSTVVTATGTADGEQGESPSPSRAVPAKPWGHVRELAIRMELKPADLRRTAGATTNNNNNNANAKGLSTDENGKDRASGGGGGALSASLRPTSVKGSGEIGDATTSSGARMGSGDVALDDEGGDPTASTAQRGDPTQPFAPQKPRTAREAAKRRSDEQCNAAVAAALIEAGRVRGAWAAVAPSSIVTIGQTSPRRDDHSSSTRNQTQQRDQHNTKGSLLAAEALDLHAKRLAPYSETRVVVAQQRRTAQRLHNVAVQMQNEQTQRRQLGDTEESAGHRAGSQRTQGAQRGGSDRSGRGSVAADPYNSGSRTHRPGTAPTSASTKLRRRANGGTNANNEGADGQQDEYYRVQPLSQEKRAALNALLHSDKKSYGGPRLDEDQIYSQEAEYDRRQMREQRLEAAQRIEIFHRQHRQKEQFERNRQRWREQRAAQQLAAANGNRRSVRMLSEAQDGSPLTRNASFASLAATRVESSVY